MSALGISMLIGVPSVLPSNTPERIWTVSVSLRWVTMALWPGTRRSRSGWMSASESARRGGQPSTTAPMPVPCDSPQVVTRKSWPQVLPTARGYRSRCGSDVECEVEGRGPAWAAGGRGHGQLAAAVAVQAVALVAETAAAPPRVRRPRVHAVGDRLVEVDLRGELLPLGRSNLEVDVHGAALVPAGIDRGEARQPGRARRLVPPQEPLALGAAVATVTH